jgi:hypothetical protein
MEILSRRNLASDHEYHALRNGLMRQLEISISQLDGYTVKVQGCEALQGRQA